MSKSSEHSHNCTKCGKEILVELEYTDINYDPRDGYTEYGYQGGIVDKEFRECQCDFSSEEEEKIINEVIDSLEFSYIGP